MKKLSLDTIKKMRQIEICTRRLLNGSLMGDNRSAVKGSGFEFDQIRDYQMGDDIRFIDWSSSARANKLLVKQYIEERNRTIMIAVDISASSSFSSSEQMRSEVMAQLASVLALVGDYGKDYVGLILFSDTVEYYLPPSKGRSHIHALMEKLYSFKPRRTKTNIAAALQHLLKISSRNGIAFIISDFIDQHSFEKSLRTASKKYDIIALRCLDAHEQAMPSLGFVMVEDTESGTIHELDLRSSKGAVHYFLRQRSAAQQKMLKKYGVSCVDIALDKPFIGEIIRFFRARMMY